MRRGSKLNHIGLFEGIGGFSLAARWAGWETIAWCEINPFGQKVLKYHFPKAAGHDDIKKTDFTIYRGKCDVLTGGFPCQTFSLAGDRGNDLTLWKEMLRAVTEIQPGYVVAENVFGILSAGDGDTINIICSDLEAAGYEKPVIFDCTADSFDLPTLERHIWIVTKTNRIGQEGGWIRKTSKFKKQRKFQGSYQGEQYRWNLPESRVLCVGKRIPTELDEVAAYGNAIPPQVAYEIFKVINELNNE